MSLVEDCQHQVVVVDQENEAQLLILELGGHRATQCARLLLHLRQRLLQAIGEGTSLRGAQCIETRRQLRIPACHQVRMRRMSVGHQGQVLLASLAQGLHVLIQHHSEPRSDHQLLSIQVRVQAADLPSLHALPVEVHNADHEHQAYGVPAIHQEGLQGVQEELRGLPEDLHEEAVVPFRVEEVIQEEKLGSGRVHEEHLVAPKKLLMVVLDLVLVGVRDDGVFLQLLEDRVATREGEDVALAVEGDARPQADVVQEAPGAA
mmetsp:Transcript_129880/g.416787  ORF Transcript_129880/g.416787 Transcript_129880/m.416787 type:complete len:262 (+) Transcript_129880:560-1345(+)